MDNKQALIIENLDTHHPLIVTLMKLINNSKKAIAYSIVTPKNYKLLQGDFKEFFELNKQNIIKFNIQELNNITNRPTYYFKQVYYSIKKTLQIRKLIKNKKISCIFLNTPESKQNIFLLGYLLTSGKKVIITHHDSLFDHSLGKIYLSLIKMAIKKSVASIFLGDYLKLEDVFKPKEKIYLNYIYDFDNKKYPKYKKTTFVLNSHPKIQNRDYETLFRTFSEIINENKNLKKKFKIIIPLRISSKEIYEIIEKYNLKDLVKTFSEYVSEDKLMEILKKSHYSIIPFYPNSQSGTSRITATVSYNCAFALPTILPETYFKNSKHPKEYAYEYKFNDNSLKDILKKLIKEKYNKKKVSAQFAKYRDQYGINHLSKRMAKLI